MQRKEFISTPEELSEFFTRVSTFMGSFSSIEVPIGMGACLVGAFYYGTLSLHSLLRS